MVVRFRGGKQQQAKIKNVKKVKKVKKVKNFDQNPKFPLGGIW